MTTKTTNRSHRNHSAATQHEPIDHPKEITNDVVEYLTAYFREKPGYAALACVGIGFVLGWKLKPW